jgi:hypothetical protein
MERWAAMQPDFGDPWEGRAALAGGWLAEANTIADLGCGTMNLERYLRAGQTYIPVDLTARDERTLILDLNRPSDLDRLPGADACALLGVLEYSYLPDALLEAVRRAYRQVVLTFNVRLDDQGLDARLEHGWINHYSSDEIAALFAQHRFIVAREHLFAGRRRERLFDLRRDDA